MDLGPELVIIKLGDNGCFVQTSDIAAEVEGYSVEVLDATGAGDAFDAAIIYGYLVGLQAENMAALGNAIGAAKVRKRGTGHNMPMVAEIISVVEEAGGDSTDWNLEDSGKEN
jgi:sugar/nucleoside kinase (ribokinase family)